MGTCCLAHLTTKVQEYAPNAQNGAVTVQILENPVKDYPEVPEARIFCDYCTAPAVFLVSYFAKK